MDSRRLIFEMDQLRRLGYQVVQFDPLPVWESFGVQFQTLGFFVQARFAADHPYSPPRFEIHPAPRSKHYYDDGKGLHLCFCHPNEWRPTYSLATAAAIVTVFLKEFREGKAD